MSTPNITPTLLRTIPQLAPLSDAQLAWLLTHSEAYSYATGDLLSRPGDPAQHMLLLLTGGFFVRADSGEGPAYRVTAPAISGYLPFSRMTRYTMPSRAIAPTTLLALDKSHFPALYQELPELIPSLVGLLTDRVRESTRTVTQSEKLTAIGKLTAGLAHELNNPSAAARQAATSLRDLLACYRDSLDQLAVLCNSPQVYAEIRALEAAAQQPHPPLDSLTQSDREESLLPWLEQTGLADAWRVAPALVQAGFTQASLAAATHHWAPALLPLALARIAASFELSQVLAQMDHATSAMSSLVQAMKSYSFMDRAAHTQLNLNQSLETTLLIFSFRLKHGIQLVKEFDAQLPPVPAHASELSQVWTNLIDNALDALEGHPQPRLRLTTRRELNTAVVEINDNGPGIPPDVQPRIFDPFFTTKPMGEGTGLGLDTVYRIVQQHHGLITVQSTPGDTTFTLRLPLEATPFDATL